MLLTDWYVGEHLALALLVLAVDFLVLDIVKVVLLEAMTAEALTGRSDRLAVLSSLHISPVYVETVLTLLTDSSFVGLELCFAHHLTTIVITDDSFILEIGLHMRCSLIVQH